MRNILGRRRLRAAVAAAAAGLTLLATPSAGTTQSAGTTHNHEAHVHSANASAVASAEPNHTATLNRANPKFTWEGSGSGAGFLGFTRPDLRCTGAPLTCEYILLDVNQAGELALTLDITGGVSEPTVCGVLSCGDVALVYGYVYRSNAAGEPLGETLTPGGANSCATGSARETCKVAVEAGYYLIEVEYSIAVEARYIGTAELVPAVPGPPPADPQTVTLDGCNLTLYYFKDSAERLQALVPEGYRVRPYHSYPLRSPLVATEGSAVIAAWAYDCDRIEVPGAPAAPAIFTLLSVLVYPPGATAEEAPGVADFYVLSIHANNPDLVELLVSRGMPADLVPGMVFEKPVQSVAVRVEVPWSQGAYELETTGFQQDPFHQHHNSYWHDSTVKRCQGHGARRGQDGCTARMDFVARGARDHHCAHQADHHAIECGKLTAQAGTPVASFFGGADRTADTVWDHDPLERSWFVLQ